ncbi:hypothetical protein FKW77_002329 [Venturia effusa]|uniref:UBA domain-containing protein n=1 Tax=Venturia effusa TaxID=50376 RepID=A0A517L8S3_9PEZI|nr:hypothetical protein FKW77_002329 [Venturia effusa]
MAKKGKKKKNQQQRNKPRPLGAAQFLKITHKSKGSQVFDLLKANAKGKDEPYYQTHYKEAIRRCKDYWKNHNYDDPHDRAEWQKYNKSLVEDKWPEVWEPTREAQIRDTEIFWSGMTRDAVLAPHNTPRWQAENRNRTARGLPPIDRDRVRPWSEIPMYLPYDPDVPEYQLDRTQSANTRYNDRPVRYAMTYVAGTNFILTPDVDARPWLVEAQYNNSNKENNAAGKKRTSSATPGHLNTNGEDIVQADAPMNPCKSIVASIFGLGGTENVRPTGSLAKVTDEKIEELLGIVGPIPRKHARMYLEANSSNIQEAVEMFYMDEDLSEEERITSC